MITHKCVEYFETVLGMCEKKLGLQLYQFFKTDPILTLGSEYFPVQSAYANTSTTHTHTHTN